MNERIQRVIDALNRNNIDAIYLPTAAEVLAETERRLTPGSRIAVGGSETLKECGVMTLLRSGKYDFLDRSREGITPAEAEQVMTDSLTADWFLCSANAITEQGELYNVDGRANRVAALAYGPKQVLVIAGVNKLVTDLEEAILRVKTVAAPKNTCRLQCDTPCAHTGHCLSIDQGKGTDMTAGCHSERRICWQYLVTGGQRTRRITVLLCGEPLGY